MFRAFDKELLETTQQVVHGQLQFKLLPPIEVIQTIVLLCKLNLERL